MTIKTTLIEPGDPTAIVPHKLYLVRVEGEWAIGRFLTVPGTHGWMFRPSKSQRIFALLTLVEVYELNVQHSPGNGPGGKSKVVPFLKRAA